MTEWVIEDRINPAAIEEAQRHVPVQRHPRWLHAIQFVNVIALALGQYLVGILAGLVLLLATGIDRSLTPLFTLGGGFLALWALQALPRQHGRSKRKAWLQGLSSTLRRERFILSPRGLRVEGSGWVLELDWDEVVAIHVDRLGMTFVAGGRIHTLSFHDAFTRADAARVRIEVEAWKATASRTSAAAEA